VPGTAKAKILQEVLQPQTISHKKKTMFTITKCFIAVALITMSAGSAFAQSVQYLGPSSGTGDGDTGILGFNELCQATYEDGAQFCTSEDVLRSGSPPATPNVVQWVMPTIVGSKNSAGWILVIDITGRSSSPAHPAPGVGKLSCQGWSNPIDSLFGLTMTSTGSFGTQHCASDLPAACCKVTSGPKDGSRSGGR